MHENVLLVVFTMREAIVDFLSKFLIIHLPFGFVCLFFFQRGYGGLRLLESLWRWR